MEFNNYFSDENSFKEDLIDQDSIFSNNLKVNHMEDTKEKKELTNKVIYAEEFEKAFNKIFNHKNKEIFGDNEEEKTSHFIQEKIKENSNIQTCTDEKIIIRTKEKKDKFFPFSPGKGLIETLKSIGLKANIISSSKISLSINKKKNIFINSKFKTTDYYIDDKGNKKILKKIKKKKRKFKPDDIRKKIKSRFHKVFKNIINTKLKNAGSQKLFDFLPQSFITNITIKLNSQSMGLTYQELIEQNFFIDSNEKRKKSDNAKYNKNIEVLKYLNENPEISKLSDFIKIKNMKYADILKAYFSSFEFEQSLIDLYQKEEEIEYIEEYLDKALTYVNFFTLNIRKIQNITINKNNQIKIFSSNDEEDEENSE